MMFESAGRMQIFPLVRNVIAEYGKNDCASRAAAVAYFALASLFPGLLLALTLSTHFISNPRAQARFVDLIATYLPVANIRDFVISNLNTTFAWRGVMGAVGLALLAWSAKGIFVAMERGLNAVWHVEKGRNTLTTYAIAICGTLLLNAVLVIQLTFNALLRTFLAWQITPFGYSISAIRSFLELLSWLISPFVLFAVFSLLYMFMPKRHIGLRHVWPGALFASITYRGIETAFLWYFTRLSHVAVLYGTASGLIVLLIWTYLSANIFFIGAELIYCIGQTNGVFASDGITPSSS